MRILEIGKYYPPQRGGMETALHDLATRLAARGHRVRVVVSAASAEGEFEDHEGVEVVRVPRYGTLASVSIAPGFVAAVRRSLREVQPDVVHLHLPNPLGASAWMLAGHRRPLVVTYHSDIVRQRWLGALWEPWRRRVLAHATAIHVTSEAMRDHSAALAAFRERCHVIPLGVDPKAWGRAPAASVRRWQERCGSRFFLFVGRLVYYKGIDVALEALRDTDCRLVIAGDGPMREEWEALARDHDLGDRVHFLGEVPPEDLPGLYHAASAFLLPSQAASEAFGIVQLEAMAAGLPVVACRASGGVASVHVDRETALLVPPADPQALRHAMLEVHRDETLARSLGRNGRRRVETFFDLNSCTERLEALLDQAVRGASTAP